MIFRIRMQVTIEVVAQPRSASRLQQSDTTVESASGTSAVPQKAPRSARQSVKGCVGSKRLDGTWYGYVSLDRGKPQVVHGQDAAADVQASKSSAELRAALDGMPIPPERGTVAQFLDDWLDWHRPDQGSACLPTPAITTWCGCTFNPSSGRVIRLEQADAGASPRDAQPQASLWTLSRAGLTTSRAVLRIALEPGSCDGAW